MPRAGGASQHPIIAEPSTIIAFDKLFDYTIIAIESNQTTRKNGIHDIVREAGPS